MVCRKPEQVLVQIGAGEMGSSRQSFPEKGGGGSSMKGMVILVYNLA